MTARVEVSSEILDWALSRCSNRSAVEHKFPKISEWQAGTLHPTFRQVEQFAQATHTPFGYFFLAKPPDIKLPIPHYRTIKDEAITQPSADMIETVELLERRQEWLKEFLIEDGSEKLSFVSSSSVNDSPKKIADSIRSVLKLTHSWASKLGNWTDALKELRDRIEVAGIFVVTNGVVANNTHRKLDPGEFRGFVLVDDYAPMIFVNGSDSKSAQMFTIAHEIAHVWLGKSAAFDLDHLEPASDKVEKLCNQAAAELLVPETEMKNYWPAVVNKPNNFEEVSKHFKVSKLVAARRALDLGLINRNIFFSFYKEHYKDEVKKKESEKKSGGDFYATQDSRVGKRFAEFVISASKEGRLPYSEAYELTGLYGQTFKKYAESISKKP